MVLRHHLHLDHGRLRRLVLQIGQGRLEHHVVHVLLQLQGDAQWQVAQFPFPHASSVREASFYGGGGRGYGSSNGWLCRTEWTVAQTRGHQVVVHFGGSATEGVRLALPLALRGLDDLLRRLLHLLVVLLLTLVMFRGLVVLLEGRQ